MLSFQQTWVDASIVVLVTATVDAPDKKFHGMGFTRVRLEDHPNCNIGIHFDLISDKIGK